MMQITKNLRQSVIQIGLILLMALASSGCAVKWVADYDSVAFEEILKVGKKVDKFYGDLLEKKADERSYPSFSDRYVDIEADIRSLVTRNKARALNEESIEIAETTLTLWIKYKESHKAASTYPDGKAARDRSRFTRLFAAAASAERAKNLDADDKDVTKDSKQ